jgi:hypothetical protein
MNWTWNIRSADGGMNALDFAKATTAGGWERVLVHAAPGQMQVEVTTDESTPVASGQLDRDGDYSPITLLTIKDGELERAEVWPTGEHHRLPVILAGGEVGILQHWEHADDRSWWRWQVEFSNHKGRPADWTPPE